ncbi:FtsW/RodA/SpoVE family cell cycle protein [Duganella qianjiadongensis]|uniref:Probable peptidoglycan glycosyltransferase FtsW n=1 Tax=Duganella qianjiadongensis TaxID=2692176 RepID=A0ABW9VGM0_9BURK|nr:FtsW/RodA/SpoVE family cell cycle protein [Duganella qianjiadongensis]MYM37749.1 FtsW/RodA/SpoVE family cell cycle protein [Duganella qianjiadongensis]
MASLLRLPGRVARPHTPAQGGAKNLARQTGPGYAASRLRSLPAIAAALLLPLALLTLQLVALNRAPPAWQPASIGIHLPPGASVDLGAQELAATQADRRHLRLRHDIQQGWMVQNISSTHRLLVQTADTEQHSGSAELASGQRFQIAQNVFSIDTHSGQELAFSALGHQWRYDGAVLYRDGLRQTACPQSHWPARLVSNWNTLVPRWLALARPLTLGGNLYCDNRLGLPQLASASAIISKRDGRFVLDAGQPDAEQAPLMLLPQQTGAAAQNIRLQEMPLAAASSMIVGHTRFALAISGDTLNLRPTQHVRLYAAPEVPLDQSIEWHRQARQLGLGDLSAPFRALALAMCGCLAGIICLYVLQSRASPRHVSASLRRADLANHSRRRASPLRHLLPALHGALAPMLAAATALLLAGCGLTALILQRSLQAPPASLSLLLAACALLLWLSHPDRRELTGICACSLLALGLLSQLELGLAASESTWLRFYQKSSALLAIAMALTVLCQQWLKRREAHGLHGSQRRIEWLLAAYAALALCALLLQVLFGDETGVFDLQPVELAKLALTALSAHCLALRFNWQEQHATLAQRSSRWLHLIAPALLFLMLLGLALVQVDDFSPLILLLVWCTAMALAYALAARHNLLLLAVLGLMLLAAACVASLRLLGSDELIRWGFYADRFLVWLHPALHPHTGQQLLAGARAIAEGGWWGSDGHLGLLTLGQSAGEVLHVPAIQDDFAASFFLNRHGLLAGLTLWVLQALFLCGLVRNAWQNYQLACSARNFRQAWLGRFRYFTLCGGAALVLGHFLLSWGTNLAIFPIMGQPMSFLSAGGSHLLFFLCPLLAFSAFSAPSMQGE